MGKKKRQNQTNNSSMADSSESESNKESAQANEGDDVMCPHAIKSVNISNVRKTVKTNTDVCKTCSRCKENKSELCKDRCICLNCGICNCGPDEVDHSLKHSDIVHSDSHYLAYRVNTGVVRCFKCKKDLPIDINKKVLECVDLIKKNCDQLSPTRPVITDNKMINGTESANYLNQDFLSSHLFSNGSPSKDEIAQPILNLPKVRGLMNLGNTCFFNSVLQCLAQTPGLVELLRQMEVPGERIHLELDGVTIDDVLEKHKSSELSEQLAQVLTEVSGVEGTDMGDSRTGHFAVNPRRLLHALFSRCSHFEGGDQHDAHELLRHLLDSVHTEDLRRYQKVFLNHIGYHNKNLDELEESKKLFVKKLNQKVCDTIPIRPDHIFKGSLVSILECTVCKHKSERDEPFLDLSLPVLQEKSQPPGVRRKQQSSSPVEEEQTVENVMSKKQARREKKAGRRLKVNNRYSENKKDEAQGEPLIEEEDKKDSIDGEQSDADVEDNEDNVCDDQDHKAEIVESGYSSEKQMSARGSPVTTQSLEEEVKSKDQNILECYTYQPNLDFSTDKLLTNRVESGSIQELSITILDETNTECTSQDSVKVNASKGSPDISSDSQHGNFRSLDILSETQPPSDDNIDHTAMIMDWNCTEDVKPNSQDSSNSVSPQYCSDNVNISPKCSPSPASGSHSNDNVSMCTSLPYSNDNMSVCNSLPENTSFMLSSPIKGQRSQREETSGSEERPESRMDCLKNRGSPVDLTEHTELSPRLLKLSLEGVTYERDEEDRAKHEELINVPNKPAEPIMNNDVNGFVLIGGVIPITSTRSKSAIPLPPPLPLFTEPYTFTHSEPNTLRSSSLYPKYKIEEGELSLHSCLNQFTNIELLAGGNKVGCDACTESINKGNKDGKTVYQVSTKQLVIARLPPVMIFHLKRFQVQKNAFRKLGRHVDFPLVLDISPFCRASQEPKLYSLYGVVEHMGTLHGGHYVAYVKVRSHSEQRPGSPPPGKWYCISDSRVSSVSENEVLKSQAYLLFYERIP